MLKSYQAKLSKVQLSTWVIVLFATALILPWGVFVSVTLAERSARLEEAGHNLATLAMVYGENAVAVMRHDIPRVSNEALSGADIALIDNRTASGTVKPRAALSVPGVRFSLSRLGVPRDAHGSARPSDTSLKKATTIRHEGSTIRATVGFPETNIEAVAEQNEATVLNGWRHIAFIGLAGLILRTVIGAVIGAFLVRQLRYREVHQAQLLIATQAAQSSNHAKSAFLAHMSHELRTPLNAIIGFSEIIKTGMLGPINNRYREYAGDIYSSGTHLLNLVNGILDLSKLESGQCELNDETVDLAVVVRESARLFEPQASKGTIEMIVDVQRDIPFVRADDLMLRQILINILSNAVKFTMDGGRIRLTASRTAEGVRIEVGDTGIGMGSKQIANGQELFSQTQSRTSRKHEGAGIGLPLAKRLVELHGGTLTIKSEVNIGSTVTVFLPPERIVESTTPSATQAVG